MLIFYLSFSPQFQGGPHPHHQSKVREIPVQHERRAYNEQRSPPHGQPDLSMGGRQIPIHRVASDSPQMSPKGYGPPPDHPTMQRYQHSNQHPQPNASSPPPMKEIPIIRENTPRGSPQFVGRASGQHTPPAGQREPDYQAGQRQPDYQAGPTTTSSHNPPQQQAQSPPPQQPSTLNVNTDPERNRSPSPANLTSLERVELILAESEELQKKVNSYRGNKADRAYKFLEEMLTRLLLKLDSIDSEGREEIRNVRRQAVRIVNGSIDMLELKACANNQPVEKMQTDSGVESDSTSDTGKSNPAHVQELRLNSEINC